MLLFQFLLSKNCLIIGVNGLVSPTSLLFKLNPSRYKVKHNMESSDR